MTAIQSEILACALAVLFVGCAADIGVGATLDTDGRSDLQIAPTDVQWQPEIEGEVDVGSTESATPDGFVAPDVLATVVTDATVQTDAGVLTDTTCGEATPDKSHANQCLLCMSDLPPGVPTTLKEAQAATMQHCSDLWIQALPFDHTCPDGKHVVGVVANSQSPGWMWYFAPDGALVGYVHFAKLPGGPTCPSGRDLYGDTTCAGWTPPKTYLQSGYSYSCEGGGVPNPGGSEIKGGGFD